MAKLLFTLIFAALFFLPGFSQNKKYWIKFKDKNNSSFSLSDPSAFLSQRAIDRRTKQNIPLSDNDLPVTPAYIQAVAAEGVTIYNWSKWFNAVTISGTAAQIQAIKNLSCVSDTQYVGTRMAPGNPDDKFNQKMLEAKQPNLRTGKSLSFDYGMSYDQIHLLNGDPLHENGFRGQGMLIAVLDAGFYRVDDLPAFDSLWANNQIIATKDFVTGGTSVFEDNSHGMQVLSTMAGNVPGQLIGTAPKANYLLLRSENVDGERIIEECNWAAAAEYADSAGADIINSSLGYTDFPDTPEFSHTYADLDGNTTIVSRAADIAASKGILVFNSVGNDGGIGNTWHYMGSPADGDSVLAIGGVDRFGTKLELSSWGPSVDGDIKPNVCSMGGGCTIQSGSGDIESNGLGTSFASPIIAGMAACLWQANPSVSNMTIFHNIEKSAHQYANPDSGLGYGIPNFVKAHEMVSLTKLYTPEKNKLSTQPNPFDENGLTLNLNLDTSKNISLELFDILGKLVYSHNFKLYPGINKYKLMENNDLQKGVFFIKLSGENLLYTVKTMRK